MLRMLSSRFKRSLVGPAAAKKKIKSTEGLLPQVEKSKQKQKTVFELIKKKKF